MKVGDEVISEIENIVTGLDCEFYEARYFLSGKQGVFRIFADKENGITLDECAEISKRVSDYLDTIDFGKTTYTLEVSSPGITRMLTSVKDFERVVGKDVTVRYKSESERAQKKSGMIRSADAQKLVFEDGCEIKFDLVLNGKLAITI